MLILYVFLFAGCNDEQTAKLIDTSITSGNLLSKYYDNLIKFTLETWEMEAFNSSLREIEFPVESQNEYQKTIQYLEARKSRALSPEIIDMIKIFHRMESPWNFYSL